jgi:hypothetical protein
MLVGLSGCAALLVGAGAAGGYAIGKDSIKNHFDLPMSHVYQVSREVIGEVGLVTLEDEQRGLIKASVEGTNVTLTVKRVSEKAVELKVKARSKFLIPRIDTAQTVYNRIIQRL